MSKSSVSSSNAIPGASSLEMSPDLAYTTVESSIPAENSGPSSDCNTKKEVSSERDTILPFILQRIVRDRETGFGPPKANETMTFADELFHFFKTEKPSSTVDIMAFPVSYDLRENRSRKAKAASGN